MSILKKLILTSSIISTSAFALNFTGTESLEDFQKKAEKLDCSINTMDCRYVASMEIVSYLEACPLILPQRQGVNLTHKDLKVINDDIEILLRNYKPIQNEEIHKALFSQYNPAFNQIQESIGFQIANAPLHESYMYCQKLTLLGINVPPEFNSALLKNTINYPNWSAKKSSDFVMVQKYFINKNNGEMKKPRDEFGLLSPSFLFTTFTM